MRSKTACDQRSGETSELERMKVGRAKNKVKLGFALVREANARGNRSGIRGWTRVRGDECGQPFARIRTATNPRAPPLKLIRMRVSTANYSTSR